MCMKFSSVSVHTCMVVRKAIVGLMNVYTVCVCVSAVRLSRVTDERLQPLWHLFQTEVVQYIPPHSHAPTH